MGILSESVNLILAVSIWFGYGIFFTEYFKGQDVNEKKNDEKNIIFNFVATLIVCSVVFRGFFLDKVILIYGLQLVAFNFGKLTGLNDKVFGMFLKKSTDTTTPPAPPAQPK